jgi:hypothetical protein
MLGRTVRWLTVLGLGLGVFPSASHAQMASAYNQAAQAYREAAAKCTGAQQQCYLANATYYQCLAAQLGPNGPSSCPQPPSSNCSPAGGTSTSGGAAGLSSIPGATAGLTPRAAQIQQLGNLGLGLVQMWADKQAQKAAQDQQSQEAQEQQEEQLQIEAQQQALQQSNQDALNLLAGSAGLLASSIVPGEFDFGSPLPPFNNALDSLVDATSGPSGPSNALDSLVDTTNAPVNPQDALDNLVDATSSTSGPSNALDSLVDASAALPSGGSEATMPATQASADNSSPSQMGSASLQLAQAVDDSLATDGPGLVKLAMANSNDPAIEALNEGFEMGESAVSKGETAVEVATYAWNKFTGQTTAQEDQQAATALLNSSGNAALQGTPVVQAIVSHNLPVVEDLGSKTDALLNNAMAAVDSNQAYDETTDLKSIEYLSSSSLVPDSVLRFANIAMSTQKFIQVGASSFINFFSCGDHYYCVH